MKTFKWVGPHKTDMAQQKSLFDVADNIEAYSQNEIAEQLALSGVSMALDNGSDMLGVEPRQHAKSEWPAYIAHAVETVLDVAGWDAINATVCYQKAVMVAPGVWEDMNLSLRTDHIDNFDMDRFE